jgi:hypothetical protein
LPYISTQELSAALGLKPHTMTIWGVELLPTRSSPGLKVHRYSDVDEWLAEPGRAYGFSSPPKIETILSGRLAFIRREEAVRIVQKALPVNDAATFVWNRIKNGRIKALRLRHRSWVVSLSSIERMIRQHSMSQEEFTLEDVYLILGVGMATTVSMKRKSTTLRRLVDSGRLTSVGDPYNARRTLFSRESVRSLAGELLRAASNPIDPDDWIDDRLSSRSKLLSVPEAGELLGLAPEDVRILISNGKLATIHSPEGSKWFVSPESIDFYKLNATPFTLDEIARVFGVGRDKIVKWRASKQFVCPLHANDHLYPWYRWCIVAYLAERCGPGVSAVNWVRRALSPQGRELWTAKRIYNNRLLTAKQLRLAVEAGRIPMIFTPSGRPVYAAFQVRKESRRRG